MDKNDIIIKLNQPPNFKNLEELIAKNTEKNKGKVIERVQRYQAKQQDLEQLERLHELQQQGLINVQTGELTQAEYDKYNNRLLNRLAHLHLSS